MLTGLPPQLMILRCKASPPQEAIDEYLTQEQIERSFLYEGEQHLFLWSRLILASLPKQFKLNDEPGENFCCLDNFSSQLRFHGSAYRYGSVDFSSDWLAIALSFTPIAITFKELKADPAMQTLILSRYPSSLTAWVERQEDPKTAFFYLWGAYECLQKRQSPLLSLEVSDLDTLRVRAPKAELHEELACWQSKNWICLVQGQSLQPLLTEIRTPERTLEILGQSSSQT